MELTRWDPFRELERMREEFDRWFERLFAEVLPGRRRGPRAEAVAALAPCVDVYETEKEVVVKAELPGLTKEDVEVQATEDSVTIRGEFKRDEEVSEEGYYRRERRFGKFERVIPLPAEVKPDEAKAKFQNGVLEIRLPKVEEAPKAKKIEIE